MPYSVFLAFPDLRYIEIETELSHCNCCDSQSKLHRKWSSDQSPKSIHLGNVNIRVVTKLCPTCETKFYPETYRNLIPFDSIYGYDVIRKVGHLRYTEGIQDIKIQAIMLAEDHLPIPLSSISHLAKKDLDYFSSVHYDKADILNKHFVKNGFVLHLDGTYEGDTGIHFSMRDSISGIVLYNMKIKSENKRDIAAGTRECIKYFGRPIAVVSDLSKNIRDAVKAELADVPLLICHYHFLENIGEALLGRHKKELSAIIKRYKIIPYLSEKRKSISKAIKKYQDKHDINPASEELEFSNLLNGNKNANIARDQQQRYLALVQLNWIADYKYELKGEYFPFSIKELAFVNKCKETVENLENILKKDPNKQKIGAIYTAYEKISRFVEDDFLNHSLKQLENANAVFNETRKFFRFNSCENSPVSRVKEGEPQKSIIKNFEIKMINFEKELTQRDNDGKEHASIVLRYIDKYRDNLTGHVLTHRYGNSEVLINIPRTNNIMETLFGSFKHKMRKKIGCKKLTNHFKAMHPNEFLIENLNNQLYIDLLYGGDVNNLIKEYPRYDKQANELSIQRKALQCSHKLKKTILRSTSFTTKVYNAIRKFLKTA